jgi:hypothetical protein
MRESSDKSIRVRNVVIGVAVVAVLVVLVWLWRQGRQDPEGESTQFPDVVEGAAAPAAPAEAVSPGKLRRGPERLGADLRGARRPCARVA